MLDRYKWCDDITKFFFIRCFFFFFCFNWCFAFQKNVAFSTPDKLLERHMISITVEIWSHQADPLQFLEKMNIIPGALVFSHLKQKQSIKMITPRKPHAFCNLQSQMKIMKSIFDRIGNIEALFFTSFKNFTWLQIGYINFTMGLFEANSRTVTYFIEWSTESILITLRWWATQLLTSSWLTLKWLNSKCLSMNRMTLQCLNFEWLTLTWPSMTLLQYISI